MEVIERDRPRLRPVEAIPDPANGRIIVRDPTQLASGMLLVGKAELFLLSLLDGERDYTEIQAEFARRSGQMLLSHELESLLQQLDAAGYLAGGGFETNYAGLLEEYHALPYRPLRGPDGFGLPVADLPQWLNVATDDAAISSPAQLADGALSALVAPHLDFPRGRRAYGAGYAALRQSLREAEPPRRVVILGTNHFGRSSSVVATTKDFQTPWGVLPTDRDFLQRLQARCNGNLMPFELDHLREHSIELHTVWLHHLLGDVRIVPFLCPDPNRENGTRSGDPDGVDLKQFALSLGQLIKEDPDPTLIVASADLSHVGGYFGDHLALESGFLQAVRKADEAGLRCIEENDPEALRERMARTQNPTRWCSVGCLYAMLTALGPGAPVQRLHYHQAVTAEVQNCVSSAAFAVYR